MQFFCRQKIDWMPLLRFITALFILCKKSRFLNIKCPFFRCPKTAKKLFLYEFVVFGLQRLIWSILTENDIFMIVVFAGIYPFWSRCALKRQNCRKWSSIAAKSHMVSFLTYKLRKPRLQYAVHQGQLAII